MPSSWGPLPVVAFKSDMGDILAAVSGVGDGFRVPVRIHDACLTGEVFGSLKCDCGPQLQMALAMQTKLKHGVTVYMPQEGRGIGLANKIAAYYMQEVHGLDTIDANLALGLPAEKRDYSVLGAVLHDLGVKTALLMTNNPFKVEQLQAAGVIVEGTLPLVVAPTSQATDHYLETKRTRMGHTLPRAAPLAPPARGTALGAPAAALLAKLRQEISLHGEASRPFTLLSFASSLDGFIAAVRAREDGRLVKQPVKLSGDASLELTHHLRGCVDAILVGVGTVLADDPLLSVRVPGAGLSPRPVVLDSTLRLPPGSRVLRNDVQGGRARTLVLCTDFSESGVAGREKAARAAVLEAAGAVVLPCRADRDGRVCWHDAMAALRRAGVQSLMVEGGAEVIAGLLRREPSAVPPTEPLRAAARVDRLVVTQAGAILGSGVSWASEGRPRLRDVESFTVGQDAIFTARL